MVPAGSHSIRFEFKPVIVNTAQKASAAASIILWGLLVGLVFTSLKNGKAKPNKWFYPLLFAVIIEPAISAVH